MLEEKSNLKGWIYLLPALVLLIIFTFYPIFNAFYLAFLRDFNYLLRTADGLTFIDNFREVLQDDLFFRALINTIIIVIVSVPVSVIISLLISVWLNSIKKLQGFFQTIFFLPYVTNAIAVGMAFAVIFHRDYGLINYVLTEVFGRSDTINFVGTGASPTMAMFSLLVFITWGGLAFKIMVFLSGLQSIDKQYYDAARIDSATRSRIFRRITVPLLSPMILYITITSFIGAFKEYTAIVGMFGVDLGPRGDANRLITLVGLVYKSLSELDSTGALSQAAAAAIILFFLTLVLTLFNMFVSRKRVHY
ncbi:MAG: carbohydrate ABC transporter permease [Candidatus Izemoplasmataceae bacterium]